MATLSRQLTTSERGLLASCAEASLAYYIVSLVRYPAGAQAALPDTGRARGPLELAFADLVEQRDSWDVPVSTRSTIIERHQVPGVLAVATLQGGSKEGPIETWFTQHGDSGIARDSVCGNYCGALRSIPMRPGAAGPALVDELLRKEAMSSYAFSILSASERTEAFERARASTADPAKHALVQAVTFALYVNADDRWKQLPPLSGTLLTLARIARFAPARVSFRYTLAGLLSRESTIMP